MTSYTNILEFFSYVRDLNLCTTPFCTTCGAQEFRSLCKDLGQNQIKLLIESTRIEDLKKVSPILWYDPITIILYDGFIFDRTCALMTVYKKGIQYLLYGDQKIIIQKIGDTHIYSKTGSILDEDSSDVIGIFDNPGFYSLSFDIRQFFENKQIGNSPKQLINCVGKQGNVKAIYYAKTHDTLGIVENVKNYIYAFLETVSAADFSSVSLNGIKTKGDSEFDNLRIISTWISEHPGTPIKDIVLVDKRSGFIRLRKQANTDSK